MGRTADQEGVNIAGAVRQKKKKRDWDGVGNVAFIEDNKSCETKNQHGGGEESQFLGRQHKGNWMRLTTSISSEAVPGMLMQLLVQRKRFTTIISVIFGV